MASVHSPACRLRPCASLPASPPGFPKPRPGLPWLLEVSRLPSPSVRLSTCCRVPLPKASCQRPLGCQALRGRGAHSSLGAGLGSMREQGTVPRQGGPQRAHECLAQWSLAEERGVWGGHRGWGTCFSPT